MEGSRKVLTIWLSVCTLLWTFVSFGEVSRTQAMPGLTHLAMLHASVMLEMRENNGR